MAPKRGLKLNLDYVSAARLVFDSYIDFLNAPVSPADRADPKAVIAWNGAGRSALAHIADIEKRAEAAGDDTQRDSIGEILAEARRHLAASLDDATLDEKEAADGDPGGDA
jgi:hypothetical protein